MIVRARSCPEAGSAVSLPAVSLVMRPQPLPRPPASILRIPSSREVVVCRQKPLPPGRYRIVETTIALFQEGGRLAARSVLADAIVIVGSDALVTDWEASGGAELASATLGGKQVLMFIQDLNAKAKHVLAERVLTARGKRG